MRAYTNALKHFGSHHGRLTLHYAHNASILNGCSPGCLTHLLPTVLTPATSRAIPQTHIHTHNHCRTSSHMHTPAALSPSSLFFCRDSATNLHTLTTKHYIHRPPALSAPYAAASCTKHHCATSVRAPATLCTVP